MKEKESLQPTGIISFIKRDHLQHPDIGFAFLPNFSNKGYAYEAATAVLHKLMHENNIADVIAITIAANTSSVRLLKKLGFVFFEEIKKENETLHVYKLNLLRRVVC